MVNKLNLLRTALTLAVFVFLSTAYASADTIDFTVTITSQDGGPIPVGAVFTGSVTYAGSIDPDFTGYPPAVTSYTFDFPGAPASIDDLNGIFLQRPYIGGPLFTDFVYQASLAPFSSFTLLDNSFTIYTPSGPILPGNTNSSSTGPWETGTVTYSYPSDAGSTVPELSSIVLLGTGFLGGLGLIRRRAGSLTKALRWTECFEPFERSKTSIESGCLTL
jgi:hypothetical protein